MRSQVELERISACKLVGCGVEDVIMMAVSTGVQPDMELMKKLNVNYEYALHYRYLVEMQIEGRFVGVEWLRNRPGRAEKEYIKNSAHKTFINMCGFIGVKVGYELAQDPEKY